MFTLDRIISFFTAPTKQLVFHNNKKNEAIGCEEVVMLVDTGHPWSSAAVYRAWKNKRITAESGLESFEILS
jgi:hypothetical protein